MTVTDASVWVSRFLNDDAFHVASLAWLTRMISEGRPLVAPASMLAEVAGAITRRTGTTQLGYEVVQRIRRAPSLQLVAIDADLGNYAAEIASSYRLRGADAMYVAVAQRLQLPLVSWDKEQIERAAGLIPASEPASGPAESPG